MRCRKCSTTPPLALNLLGGRFDADYPDQVWVTILLILKLVKGGCILAVVIDLYCRMVVGWSINNRMTRDLVINGLAKAIKRRNHDPGSFAIRIAGVDTVAMLIRICSRTTVFYTA